MMNTRPLGIAKGFMWGTVSVDTYGRYGTQSEGQAPFPGAPGFGSSGGVRKRKVCLVDRNSYHLCMLQVR